jgi:hypothetical protein
MSELTRHTESRGGNSVYLDTARRMLRDFGKGRAKRLCIQNRDQNSPSTESYRFHNAVLKAIEALTDEEQAHG